MHRNYGNCLCGHGFTYGRSLIGTGYTNRPFVPKSFLHSKDWIKYLMNNKGFGEDEKTDLMGLITKGKIPYDPKISELFNKPVDVRPDLAAIFQRYRTDRILPLENLSDMGRVVLGMKYNVALDALDEFNFTPNSFYKLGIEGFNKLNEAFKENYGYGIIEPFYPYKDYKNINNDKTVREFIHTIKKYHEDIGAGFWDDFLIGFKSTLKDPFNTIADLISGNIESIIQRGSGEGGNIGDILNTLLKSFTPIGWITELGSALLGSGLLEELNGSKEKLIENIINKGSGSTFYSNIVRMKKKNKTDNKRILKALTDSLPYTPFDKVMSKIKNKGANSLKLTDSNPTGLKLYGAGLTSFENWLNTSHKGRSLYNLAGGNLDNIAKIIWNDDKCIEDYFDTYGSGTFYAEKPIYKNKGGAWKDIWKALKNTFIKFVNRSKPVVKKIGQIALNEGKNYLLSNTDTIAEKLMDKAIPNKNNKTTEKVLKTIGKAVLKKSINEIVGKSNDVIKRKLDSDDIETNEQEGGYASKRLKNNDELPIMLYWTQK